MKQISNNIFNILKKEYEQSLVIPAKKQACQFFLCPIGLIGAGKTTVIKPLAKKLSLLRVSTDEIRELIQKRGYNYERAREIAFELIEKYARKGYSIAIDADCVRPSKRKKLEKLAKEIKAKIIWIHINPPERFILNKLHTLKYKRIGVFKDADEAVQNYFARKPLHKKLNFPFLHTFDTSRKDFKSQINSAVALIEKELEGKI